MCSNAATFARAYGVVGPSGPDSRSGSSDGAYSKHVPKPTIREQPCSTSRSARSSAIRSWTAFSGEVRYTPGVAIQAQWMQMLRRNTLDEAGDSGGIGEVARLEAHALDTVEPRPGLVADDRVDLRATRSKRADDARPDEAGSAGHERPH